MILSSLPVRAVAFCALVAASTFMPLMAAPRPSAPENLNVRIIGTASFQGRQTALIEDSNTLTDSFYRVGDSIYGYKITQIAQDGIFLTQGAKPYFVPFTPTAVRSRSVSEGAQQKVIIANNYLPDTVGTRLTQPNFYVDAVKTTRWDIWTPEARRVSRPAGSAAVPGSREIAGAVALPTRRLANAVVEVAKAQGREIGGRFRFPLVSFKKLTSGFGYRVHPIAGRTKMHKGIDLSAPTGTRIFAADAGTVTFAGWRGGYGYCVIIDHHNGYSTLYGHCSKLLADVGDNVRRGEYIANVGSTGASTGPHLHFEVRRSDVPIDPKQFFRGIL